MSICYGLIKDVYYIIPYQSRLRKRPSENVQRAFVDSYEQPRIIVHLSLDSTSAPPQQTCLLCHTADMSAVCHSRHVCCATQQTRLLYHTADMSAVSQCWVLLKEVSTFFGLPRTAKLCLAFNVSGSPLERLVAALLIPADVNLYTYIYIHIYPGT